MKFLQAGHVNRHLLGHDSYLHKCNFEGCYAKFYSPEYLQEHQRIKGHEVKASEFH